MNCVHCKKPNPERWFYCRACGKKASEAIFTTNLYMMSEAGKRSDIEFSQVSMDSHIDKMKKEKTKKLNNVWKERVRQAGVN